MRRIFTILLIANFTILSCNDNKSGTKKVAKIENETTTKKVAGIENETESQNSKLETYDTLNSNNFYTLHDTTTYIKELDLFEILDLEENANKKVGFISMSDIYSLSEDPDSLAIPNLENVDKSSLQYFQLNSSYRKRFLSKTFISETDSVFIYDYSTDVLLSFPVNKLNVVAFLNFYSNVTDCPCSQIEYMIGFEVAKSNLKGIGKFYTDALVFIGRENPFMRGQMKPIVWEKIKTEKFPSEKSTLTERDIQSKQKNTVKGQAYLYETDTYQIFIQDYNNPEYYYIYKTQDRHLIVINKQHNKIENEMLLSASESATLAPLNFGIDGNGEGKIQWTGRLFKNKSEVFFGFYWVSFGCPSINFLNSKNKYVEINCDNRH